MTRRIAFYAPLKPPDHPTPSGDRRFARLLMEALRAAGYSVELASALRTRNATGDTEAQARLEADAAIEFARLMDQFHTDPPDLWFTYHNYYKAPDLLGPAFADALDMPYVIAEASHAPQRGQGPWARGASLSEEAIRRADLILQPNPKDLTAVELLGVGDRQTALPPFLDVSVQTAERPNRADHRDHFARHLGLNPDTVWAVATGMMRFDVKRDSFLLLADVAARLPRNRFSLVLVGDGPARPEIETAFANQHNVRFAGQLSSEEIIRLNAAADLFLWPAINEAFGMALLEAQAAGLPAVVGDRPGTRGIVVDKETGILAPEGDAPALASSAAALVEDGPLRAQMSSAAEEHIRSHHDISGTASFLKQVLNDVIARKRPA